MIKVSSAPTTAQRYDLVCRAAMKCIAVMCFLCTACQPESFDSAEELKEFVTQPSNNLVRKVVTNGFVVEVSFKPNDLLIYQEIGGGPADHQRLVNLERKYEGNYYFHIRLFKTDSSAKGDGETEEPKIRDVYGSIYKFLRVVTPEEDTLRSDKFAIEYVNIANDSASEMMIVLSKKSTYRDWIQFNLKEFGLGIGDHEFRFSVKDLEQVPKLRFDVIS